VRQQGGLAALPMTVPVVTELWQRGYRCLQPAGRVFWLATVLRCRDGRQPCRAALLCGCLAFGLGRSKLVLFA
jgi:hypothetical protein